MQIDTSIFKAYDVRGIYPTQLNEDVAYAFGRAYAKYISSDGKKLKIAVGSDMRVSGPALKERLIAGLLDSGFDVDDLGLVSTPAFYFSCAFNKYDGGIQVSASHNPKEWNGFKVVAENSKPISGETGLEDIKEIILSELFLPIAETKGSLEYRLGSAEQAVKEQLTFALKGEVKNFKVVIDAANGMGSEDMRPLFKNFPCEVIEMNFNPDGTFPAHEADPAKAENNTELQKKVVAEKADFGIAIDGDGDRYFFVDEKGEMVPQQILRGIMAAIELKENPGATVAYDIRPGKITADIIEQNGGKGIITPSGHSLIKEIMAKEGAVFGGESSGHYFYKLPYGTFEAPVVLVTKLLMYLTKENKALSEVLAAFKVYANSGEMNFKVGSREQAEMIINLVKSKYNDGEIATLDGISITYPEFWFNLRPSNTEPLIRFTIEAKSQKIMEVKRDEILEILKQF